jgi:hypothetical protein
MSALEIQIKNLILEISQQNDTSSPEVVGVNYKLNSKTKGKRKRKNSETTSITYAIIKWYRMLGQYTIPSITKRIPKGPIFVHKVCKTTHCSNDLKERFSHIKIVHIGFIW